MTVIYGIPNCSSVKKARQHLDNAGIAYRFVNFKTDLPNEAHLRRWLEHFGSDILINKKGTTWRNLAETERQIDSPEQALTLIMQHPSVIKRPILEHGDTLEIGFDAQRYTDLFA